MALIRAVVVLVITSPARWLANPGGHHGGHGAAAEHGILIQDAWALELAQQGRYRGVRQDWADRAMPDGVSRGTGADRAVLAAVAAVQSGKQTPASPRGGTAQDRGLAMAEPVSVRADAGAQHTREWWLGAAIWWGQPALDG